MNPVIRVDGVSKRYGKDVALQDVSLEVPPGVVFALLGENGAGKSTVIRILLGLTEPDQGTAEVLNHDSTNEGEAIRRRVGYVPERPTLYDWMSVQEIGWFTAGFYENGYLDRYRDLIGQFALAPEKKLRSLSKGMRAKVSLALALALDPALLVMDEPTSGLDTMVRREFLESMVDRAAEGKTVLLASHQIHEVERVADMVAIVHEGRLVLVERLDQLKAEVREVIVTLKPDAEPPMPEGLIDREFRGRQCRMLVRQREDAILEDFGQHPSALEVEVRTPSLEEIFVGYVAGRNQT